MRLEDLEGALGSHVIPCFPAIREAPARAGRPARSSPLVLGLIEADRLRAEGAEQAGQ